MVVKEPLNIFVLCAITHTQSIPKSGKNMKKTDETIKEISPMKLKQIEKKNERLDMKYGRDFRLEKHLFARICPKCKKEIMYFNSCCGDSFKKEIESDYISYKSLRLKQEPTSERVKYDAYLTNAKILFNLNPYFYDKSGLFWIWKPHLYKYEWSDDIDMVSFIDNRLSLEGLTITKSMKSNYLEACKRVGRMGKIKIPKPKYIQFLDKAYNIETKQIYNIEPRFFFANPIPWELGESQETPTLDRLFKEWVGEKYVPTLYEIIAYCCYSEYPIQTLFCLCGTGRNGKSQFLKVLSNFIGRDNLCSTELDVLIENRFESFKLYKKLLCTMGETNFGIMRKTSLLKKLCGGDYIGFEKKNKDPFDDINYAKILIASNSLPSSEDTSDGFMRRWQIIEFPNEFPEGKDIIKCIPPSEYNNLASKCISILPELLKKGSLTNQGTIEQRKRMYQSVSNPLPLFINQCCEINESFFVSRSELYTGYVHYLIKNKRRKVKIREFDGILQDEGYLIEKTSKKVGISDDGYGTFKSTTWVNGLSLKSDWRHCADYAVMPAFSLTDSFMKNPKLKSEHNSIIRITEDLFDKNFDLLVENGVVETQELMKKIGDVGETIMEHKIKNGDYYEPKKGYISRV